MLIPVNNPLGNMATLLFRQYLDSVNMAFRKIYEFKNFGFHPVSLFTPCITSPFTFDDETIDKHVDADSLEKLDKWRIMIDTN